MSKSNMYTDSVKQWNVFVGCKYECIYCRKSFQAQMKRQKHNCMKCYLYQPHFHPERLKQSLPQTKGDEFIWACSSGDFAWAKKEWMEQILERVRNMPDRNFFFQTKNPLHFGQYRWPKNVILGITLETNRGENYCQISKALPPSLRYSLFRLVPYPQKRVTIEPILEFDMDILVRWIYDLKPEKVYIGYDTKKNNLPEPPMEKTITLFKELSKFTKVTLKYMKKKGE